MELVLIIISAMLVNNFVFSRFLGICPYLGVSKKMDSAVGMGLAVIFVMTLSSAITWFLDKLLTNLGLGFLRTIVFILVIASFVQFIELFIKKNNPSLYDSLGIYLPLITTNCSILGLVVLNSMLKLNFLGAVFHALGASTGFALALVIFAAVRERLELYEIPKPFQDLSIALITAGLLSMAFMGFQGIVK